ARARMAGIMNSAALGLVLPPILPTAGRFLPPQGGKEKFCTDSPSLLVGLGAGDGGWGGFPRRSCLLRSTRNKKRGREPFPAPQRTQSSQPYCTGTALRSPSKFA